MRAPAEWRRQCGGLYWNEDIAMIMSGKKDATLRNVRLIDIHGTRFYDIDYTHDEALDLMRSARIGIESAYDDPRPGDAVVISYLRKVATTVVPR